MTFVSRDVWYFAFFLARRQQTTHFHVLPRSSGGSDRFDATAILEGRGNKRMSWRRNEAFSCLKASTCGFLAPPFTGLSRRLCQDQITILSCATGLCTITS